ncbi:MAG: hypothetical protein ABI999_11825 [Acidobacteriota bacterium]
MKKRTVAFFVYGILAVFICGCRVDPPTIASITFELGDKPATGQTSFTVGDDIWAVIVVANSKEKLKVKSVFTAEKVDGITSGQVLLDNTTDIPNGQVRMNYMGLTKPGQFKEEVTLMDNTGKVLDTRSAAFTLKPKNIPATDSDPANATNRALKTLENIKLRSTDQNSK